MASIGDIFNQAQAAYDRQDHDQALNLFGRIQPEHGHYYARSLSFMGQILRQKGDSAHAEQYLRSSARLMPDPDVLYQLAELLIEERRGPEAEPVLRRCLEVDPKYTDAHIRLGMLLRDRGQRPEAIRSFELAILNDQRAVVARYFLAQLCLDSGDQKRALSQLHFVLQLQPDYKPARLLMGDIFQRLGDHRQALVEYCLVANQSSSDASLFQRMGQSFQAIGDRPQALKAYERAFGLDPGRAETGLHAAQMREEQGHYERALNLYRQLQETYQYREAATEAIERLERMFSHYNLSDRPDLVTDPGEAAFDAPPVQPRNVTEPFGAAGPAAGGFNTSDLASRRPARTAPIRAEAPTPAPPEATPLEGFLKGMMDSLKKHVPNEAIDAVKQRLDDLDNVRRQIDLDTLKQKVDLDAIKRRFGR
ncbi:MAG TPA: tetratricopeptide repeat protein [Stenomitos sp.]